MPDRRIVSPRLLDGLGDTFGILVDANSGSVPAELAGMQASWKTPPVAARRRCRRSASCWSVWTTAATRAAKGPHRFETRRWARALAAQCTGRAGGDLHSLAPDGPQGIPTLREVAALPGDAPQAVHARERIAAIESLAQQAAGFAQMEYDFLFDRARHLLTIGYNVPKHRARPELLRPAGVRGPAV